MREYRGERHGHIQKIFYAFFENIIVFHKLINIFAKESERDVISAAEYIKTN